MCGCGNSILPNQALLNPWAVTKKLTQISRISKKTLLCNALMNTHLYVLNPIGGLSCFGRHAPATMHHAVVHNAPSVKLMKYVSVKLGA